MPAQARTACTCVGLYKYAGIQLCIKRKKKENRRTSVTDAKMHIFEQAASCKGEGFKRFKFEVRRVQSRKSWKSLMLEKFKVEKV